MEAMDAPVEGGGFRPLRTIAGVANAVFRTAANAVALVEDSELRRSAPRALGLPRPSCMFSYDRPIAPLADSVRLARVPAHPHPVP